MIVSCLTSRHRRRRLASKQQRLDLPNHTDFAAVWSRCFNFPAIKITAFLFFFGAFAGGTNDSSNKVTRHSQLFHSSAPPPSHKTKLQRCPGLAGSTSRLQDRRRDLLTLPTRLSFRLRHAALVLYLFSPLVRCVVIPVHTQFELAIPLTRSSNAVVATGDPQGRIAAYPAASATGNRILRRSIDEAAQEATVHLRDHLSYYVGTSWVGSFARQEPT
ncbi:hypothetical protein K438DRAFT_550276 [Mycena galopus ATCC 62051]|nr:hypothetical protein K438DRAFT_550276 [Mycena galopus ATCC 62051]